LLIFVNSLNFIFYFFVDFQYLVFISANIFFNYYFQFDFFYKFVTCLIKNYNKMAYKINADECTACGTCAGDCPMEAIISGDIYTIDPTICTECGTCIDSCPVSAIVLE
jgi:NAD-dependent dihydropyrimidine dehydrogenase PreA subunit